MNPTDASVHAGLACYWPGVEEIRQCIGTEAEALPDAVLLAVHRNVDLLRRPFGGSDPGSRCNEQALLDFVLGGLKPEGYLLAPITGPSGAGKSHLVRWLEIRLRHHPKAKRFNLIRVPKSASLRTVIEAILQPVAHLPAYAELLRGVNEAASALAPSEASALFGTMMQLGLKEKAAQWQQGRAASLEGFGTSILAGHALELAKFLPDPVVAPYFVDHVYPRLLARALRGRDVTSDDADRPPQFELGDLELPSDIDERLNEAARTTQVYYRSRVERGNGREAALAALNAVIDGAVARVFKIGQQSQGKTLQDIMREIRETLYASGQELVLLVEDFFALTGIQEQLLNLCIQGVNDGPRPMCPMRTVLAMTDGTLVGRDTIATRSEFEWVLVTEDPQEEHVIDALVELTGRYLNAARIGRARLLKSYHAGKGTVEHLFTPEIQDPDSSELLKDFGVSGSGIPLFPLSRSAICFLARKHLIDSGKLRFNPRRALQRIVRDVLLSRDSFERGTFPAGLAIQDEISVDLTGVLRQVTDPALKERYQRIIVCWANNPQDEEELRRLPSGVFKAFGLKPLFDPGMTARTEPQPPDDPGTKPIQPPERAAENPLAALTALWRSRFDVWVGGQRLNLKDAQHLRNLILRYVVSYVDWNALSLDPADFDAQSIALPNALGQDRLDREERPVVQVTGPSGRSDKAEPELARELLALIRFDATQSIHDNLFADEDSVFVGAFLDRMAHKLVNAALHAADLKMVPLAHGAVRSGTLRLGLPTSASLLDRLRVALRTDDPEPVNSGAAKWDELRRLCWDQREALCHLILRYMRVVQGEAATVHAVDFARFARALSSAAPDAAAIKSRLDQDDEVTPAVRGLLAMLSTARLKALTKDAIALVSDWKKVALTETGLKGEASEPGKLCQAAVALMDSALKSGLWPQALADRRVVPDHSALATAAQKFSHVDWANLVNRTVALEAVDSVADPMIAIPVLATLPWEDLKAVRVFIEDYAAFSTQLKSAVAAEEAVLAETDTVEAINSVSLQLELLEQAVTNLSRDVQ